MSIMLLATLACNATGVGLEPETVATADTAPTEAVGAPVVTEPPAVDPTAACPQATADTQAHVSRENGYCFLVPASMKLAPPDYLHPNDVVAYVGPPNDPNSFEPFAASISVSINAPAEGLDSVSYAQKWIDSTYGNPLPIGLDMKVTPATIGGLPAGVVTHNPGMIGQQTGFVVANGYRYTVTVAPPTGEGSPVEDEVSAAWNTVTQSIVFFAPSVARVVVTPEDACPTAGADTKLHIDYQAGMCFLVPGTFAKMPDFSSGFQGPTLLGDIFGRPLHAELVLGYGGPANGQTPRQLFEPRLVNEQVSQIDVAGAQEVALSGFSAIVWTEGEPLGSRQAIIVANDQMYTIVNQPHNDPDYVGGQADVDLVWQTVTNSIAFFTAFR